MLYHAGYVIYCHVSIILCYIINTIKYFERPYSCNFSLVYCYTCCNLLLITIILLLCLIYKLKFTMRMCVHEKIWYIRLNSDICSCLEISLPLIRANKVLWITEPGRTGKLWAPLAGSLSVVSIWSGVVSWNRSLNP